MKKQDERSRIAMNIWTARAVPLILAAIVGYATYVLVVVLCVHYLLVKHDDHGAAIPILTIYFILFTMMTISFLRLVYVTTADPPYLPLGEAAKRNRKSASRSHTDKSEDGMSNGKYSEENGTGNTSADLRNDPDSPGLELYYTKDVFSCELDGRPRWCSECCNWKPDRAHHCSASGRCILKMDHFCPWVGGPVGENNFKFFIQFTGYTALYCLHLLVVMAIYIRRQKTSEGEKVNAQMAVILGLAAFFGLFTASMVGTALNYAIWNMTQVEKLGIKNRYHVLAVLIPPGRDLNPHSDEPPSHTEITYPLRAVPDQHQTLHENSQPGQPAVTAASRFQVSNSHPSEEPPTHTESSGIPLVNDSTVTTPPVSSEDKQLEGDMAMKISTRDQRATRKFAVLKMKPGDNPWDLGSSMLNFQTVMGYNVLDWFLPIKRSPCCNHENQESHFAVGPRVQALKASYGLIDPLPTHASQDASDDKDKSSSSGGNHSHQRKRRSRPMQPATKDGIVNGSNGSNGEAANQTDALELQDLKKS